jgi:hypothetical protein
VRDINLLRFSSELGPSALKVKEGITCFEQRGSCVRSLAVLQPFELNGGNTVLPTTYGHIQWDMRSIVVTG